jgi:DNA adenine methylase
MTRRVKYLNLAKTHGGKGTPKMLKWIISNFPHNYEYSTFLDVYGGGANITLNKPHSSIEMLNDIDFNTYNMYVCAKNGTLQRVKTIFGYTKNTFEYYRDVVTKTAKSSWTIGETEYVLRNMSRGGMKKYFAWSKRLRGGQPGDVNAWENKVAQLPEIQKRLKNVIIVNKPALDIMREYNRPDVVAYLDPPYLQSTRTAKQIYNHEMSYDDHQELLLFLTHDWKGKFLISGYESMLYEFHFGSWYNKQTLNIANNAGQTKKKSRRVECLWKNYK